MKDALNREIVEEFVGLRVKMYSLKTKKEEMKKAKGVKKNVVKLLINQLLFLFQLGMYTDSSICSSD